MKKSLAVLVLVAAGAGAAGAASAADAVPATKATSSKVEQCIGCHGIPEYKTGYPEVYRVPKIGGQSAKYIEAALQAYRKGDRKHPQMTPTATMLTDQDIAEIAAYYANQNPSRNPAK